MTSLVHYVTVTYYRHSNANTVTVAELTLPRHGRPIWHRQPRSTVRLPKAPEANLKVLLMRSNFYNFFFLSNIELILCSTEQHWQKPSSKTGSIGKFIRTSIPSRKFTTGMMRTELVLLRKFNERSSFWCTMAMTLSLIPSCTISRKKIVTWAIVRKGIVQSVTICSELAGSNASLILSITAPNTRRWH